MKFSLHLTFRNAFLLENGRPRPFNALLAVGVALAATRPALRVRLASATNGRFALRHPSIPGLRSSGETTAPRPFLALLVLALAAVLLTTGCSDTSAASASTEAAETACTYKAGHGVQLNAAARAFADLTTAEVAPQGDVWTAVPRSAVLATANGPVVYVVNGDWFLRTPVELGASLDRDQVEVTAGLYEGDRVAVGGLRVLALAEIQAVNGGVGCADGH